MKMVQPQRVTSQLPNGDWRIDVTPPSFLELPTVSLVLTPDQMQGYRQWQNGTLIQLALPELSAAQREMLLSGIGPEDFDRMFPEDE